jgi:hypothetical protein
MLLLFILIHFLSNGHTMVCKSLFIVDPIYMLCKALNSLKTEPVGGLYDLSLYLSVRYIRDA